ncbi:MAG TPA: hypothetical protein VE109_11325 [Acidobacteriaceae bacterium]|nr:hypothetical protein [Acidobacteriaceae bacterium]
MKTKKPAVTNSAAPKSAATKRNAKPANESPVKDQVDLDRRGKPLPPRQRVGGIITPQ